MDKTDMKELIYKHLFEMKDNCRFLSIGPDEVTTEFRSVAYKGMKKDCESCPFSFECAKSRTICNGRLNYNSQFFDKIFIYAEAFPFIDNKFDEILRVLNIRGEIIALVNKDKSNKCIESDLYLSEMDVFVKQINDQKLTIKSISTLKGFEINEYLRFVVHK